MFELVRVRDHRWVDVEVDTCNLRARLAGGQVATRSLICREPGTQLPHAAYEAGHRPLPPSLRMSFPMTGTWSVSVPDRCR